MSAKAPYRYVKDKDEIVNQRQVARRVQEQKHQDHARRDVGGQEPGGPARPAGVLQGLPPGPAR
jgi:hypothetical protein